MGNCSGRRRMSTVASVVNVKEGGGMLFIENATFARPAVNKSMPRLYGHALCPYAERVRLALAARDVEYQRCEINLNDKPQWHKDINGGLVPILELPDGTILQDSKVLMDYVNEAYPKQGYASLPEDPMKRAKMRLAIPMVEQFFTAWQQVISKRVYHEEEMKAFREKLHLIEEFLQRNKGQSSNFAIGTQNPTQLDIHLYACLSRPYFTKDSVFHESLFSNMKFEECPQV